MCFQIKKENLRKYSVVFFKEFFRKKYVCNMTNGSLIILEHATVAKLFISWKRIKQIKQYEATNISSLKAYPLCCVLCCYIGTLPTLSIFLLFSLGCLLSKNVNWLLTDYDKEKKFALLPGSSVQYWMGRAPMKKSQRHLCRCIYSYRSLLNRP